MSDFQSKGCYISNFDILVRESLESYKLYLTQLFTFCHIGNKGCPLSTEIFVNHRNKYKSCSFTMLYYFWHFWTPALNHMAS